MVQNDIKGKALHKNKTEISQRIHMTAEGVNMLLFFLPDEYVVVVLLQMSVDSLLTGFFFFFFCLPSVCVFANKPM